MHLQRSESQIITGNETSQPYMTQFSDLRSLSSSFVLYRFITLPWEEERGIWRWEVLCIHTLRSLAVWWSWKTLILSATQAKPHWLEPPWGSALLKAPATTPRRLARPHHHSGTWLPNGFIRCEWLLHSQLSGLLLHPPSPHVPPLSLPHAAAQAWLQTSNLSV